MTNRPKPTKTEMWIIARWNSLAKKWFRSVLAPGIFDNQRAALLEMETMLSCRADYCLYRALPVTIIANPAPPPKGP